MAYQNRSTTLIGFLVICLVSLMVPVSASSSDLFLRADCEYNGDGTEAGCAGMAGAPGAWNAAESVDISRLGPGDTFYISGTWTGYWASKILTPPCTGTLSAPITYDGDYPSNAPKGVISTGLEFPFNTWTLSNGVYKRQWQTGANHAVETTDINDMDKTIYLKKVTSKGAVRDEPGTWYYEKNTKTYYWHPINSDAKPTFIRGAYCIDMRNSDYDHVIYKNLKFSLAAIRSTEENQYLEFSNNIFQFCPGKCIPWVGSHSKILNNTATVFSNFWYPNQASEDIEFSYNTLVKWRYQDKTHPMHPNGGGDEYVFTSQKGIRGLKLIGNIIERAGGDGGIHLYLGGKGDYKNSIISGNIIKNVEKHPSDTRRLEGNAIHLGGTNSVLSEIGGYQGMIVSHNYIENVRSDNAYQGFAVRWKIGNSFTETPRFENNVILGASKGIHLLSYPDKSTGGIFKNNTFIDIDEWYFQLHEYLNDAEHFIAEDNSYDVEKANGWVWLDGNAYDLENWNRLTGGHDGTVGYAKVSAPPESSQPEGASVRMDSVVVNTYRSEYLQTTYGIPAEFSPMSSVQEFTASIDNLGGEALFSVRMTGISAKVKKLTILKLLDRGAYEVFDKYSPEADMNLGQGTWWIQEVGGNTLDTADYMEADKLYDIFLVIKDNGIYDLSNVLGEIKDPFVLGTNDAGGAEPSSQVVAAVNDAGANEAYGGMGDSVNSSGSSGGGGGAGCTIGGDGEFDPGTILMLMFGSVWCFLRLRNRPGIS